MTTELSQLRGLMLRSVPQSNLLDPVLEGPQSTSRSQSQGLRRD